MLIVALYHYYFDIANYAVAKPLFHTYVYVEPGTEKFPGENEDNLVYVRCPLSLSRTTFLDICDAAEWGALPLSLSFPLSSR